MHASTPPVTAQSMRRANHLERHPDGVRTGGAGAGDGEGRPRRANRIEMWLATELA